MTAATRLTVVDVLREVRALLADPNCWTQGEIARNRAGKPEFAESKEACCWCLVGAVWRVAGTGPEARQARRFLHVAIDGIPLGKIPNWNDTPGRTHAEVVVVVDRAIELAEAEEA